MGEEFVVARVEKKRGHGSYLEEVARAESGKTNEYSVAEEVMCVAKGTEAGDSRPDVGESLGVGIRVGKTEGRGFRGGQAQIMP